MQCTAAMEGGGALQCCMLQPDRADTRNGDEETHISSTFSFLRDRKYLSEREQDFSTNVGNFFFGKYFWGIREILDVL